MNCRQFEKLIFSYMEKELSEKVAIEFERHASECARCSAELKDTLRTVALLRRLKTLELRSKA
jgi:hypothetical protein